MSVCVWVLVARNLLRKSFQEFCLFLHSIRTKNVKNGKQFTIFIDAYRTPFPETHSNQLGNGGQTQNENVFHSFFFPFYEHRTTMIWFSRNFFFLSAAVTAAAAASSINTNIVMAQLPSFDLSAYLYDAQTSPSQHLTTLHAGETQVCVIVCASQTIWVLLHLSWSPNKERFEFSHFPCDDDDDGVVPATSLR